MAQASDKRKLATILAIDVAGYSAASERNQVKAVEQVAALRAEAAALAAREGGRIFNTAGDGLMLEFPVASGAVRVALALAEAAAKAPQERSRLRLGVHLGEVLIEGDDLLGHGVNVAARLMQRAAPNSVVISEPVKAQLHGEIDARFEPCGRVQLAKMDEAIIAFEYLPGASAATRRWRRWRRPLLGVGAAGAVAALAFVSVQLWPTPGPAPFIAVLPFDNISNDPALLYFSDGVSAEIQSDLVRYGGSLRVAGTASSFRYRGAEKDAGKIQHALGVDYIVDGSVRADSNQLRITAQLSDARSGAVLWTQSYDRPLQQVLQVQEDVSRRVAEVLRIAAGNFQHAQGDISPAAFDHYLRALQLTREGLAAPNNANQALAEFRATVDQAPNFSDAWAGLALASAAIARWQNEAEQAATIAQAREAAMKAVALDPNLAMAHAALARVSPEWAWQTRYREFQRALALSPSDIVVLNYWGDFNRRLGRMHEFDRIGQEILSLDPLEDDAVGQALDALLKANDIAGAERFIRARTAIDPNAAVLWMGFTNDRINAYDAAAARVGMQEMQTHPAAFQAQIGHVVDLKPFERDLALIAHGPPSPAALSRDGQALFEDVTGRNLGQGCAADMLPYIADPTGYNRTDLAWRLAESLYIERGLVGTTATCTRPLYASRQTATWPLFTIGAVAMRRDPRIWRIFDAVGLTQFWRQTNQWPDFCSEPNLPYNCRVIAGQRRT